jgi:hypothetical protein
MRLPLLLMGITGMAFAADADQKPAPRPRLTEAMIQQGGGTLPSARQVSKVLAPKAPGNDMTPYPVVGGGHGMIGRSDGPSPLTRPFDLEDGGTFTKYDGSLLTVEPKLEYDAPNAGWDFLKISW